MYDFVNENSGVSFRRGTLVELKLTESTQDGPESISSNLHGNA